MSDMDAVPNLGERCFRNIEKIQPNAAVTSSETFDDIGGHGERGAP